MNMQFLKNELPNSKLRGILKASSLLASSSKQAFEVLRFTNKLSPEILIIGGLFLVWRIFLFVVGLVGFIFVPLFSRNFLGGGYQLYNQFFYLMPWANYDGEHYLSIALRGYQSLEQAFFPLYPLLVHIGIFFSKTDFLSTVLSGLVISHLCFLGSLYLLFKLARLDYSSQIAWRTLLLLLLFPTSFFFAAFYTESLFLFLSVATFYFYRKNNFWLAAVCGFLASFTRVFGVLLFLSLIIDLWLSKKSLKESFPLLLIPGGLLLYMAYLWWSVGDPLAFYNLQSIIGEHRGKGIILFPQVVYRYLNILIHYQEVNTFLASFLLEFVSTVSFVLLVIVGYFKKIRISYLFYALASILLPTIQGSFSSGSRYVLVVFPVFIIWALLIEKLPRIIQVILFMLMGLMLGFFTILFIRGYWVA